MDNCCRSWVDISENWSCENTTEVPILSLCIVCHIRINHINYFLQLLWFIPSGPLLVSFILWITNLFVSNKLISVMMAILLSRSAPAKLFDLAAITIVLFILVKSVSDYFTLDNYRLHTAFSEAGNDTYKFKNIAPPPPPPCLNLVEVLI